ncbi:TfoX/Sxy family protein [Arthrobacter sp. PAMC25284]|uniref:TfoX/Sxy family protein n=1 Tax=Arthrobacter sp. PAMC25284 TaxID=2861279 RepID=UPI001C629D5C|nr:TfoX/Sxy family protein [Arthrobacter sp. PAMC25284]QYF91032.1 TfoX/Sxy family protein [Arthrobacter sp. PAMC25284]
MQMPKPSDADKERFRSALPADLNIVVKPMFGNLGAFVNGNMFAGLFGPTIGVRLSETDRSEAEATGRTVPFGPEERPMRDYTGLPAAGQDDDGGSTGKWVEKAYSYVATLPPKAPKPPKPPRAGK